MKKYTRIKHEIFEDIFAKGLLSKREMQIVSVIIRQSWGWDSGKSNWTKKRLSNTCLAGKTGLKKNHVSETLKRMILERKILVNEEGFYSFNEHPNKWSVVPKRDYLKPKISPKTGSNQSQNGIESVPKEELFSPKTGLFDTSNIDISSMSIRELREHIKAPKEIFKETLKEIFKESTNSLTLFYKEKINPKGLKTFSNTRKKMVENRLENFSLNELKQVIENISKSKWHMENKQYNFELLFRSDAKVEQYLNLKPNEPFAGEKQWLLRRRQESGEIG